LVTGRRKRRIRHSLTAGPATEKLTIPGIGLILAPVSCSITWKIEFR
jgi:hypothetical protein